MSFFLCVIAVVVYMVLAVPFLNWRDRRRARAGKPSGTSPGTVEVVTKTTGGVVEAVFTALL